MTNIYIILKIYEILRPSKTNQIILWWRITRVKVAKVSYLNTYKHG